MIIKMGRKTLTATERSFEIRRFAEDFAACVYADDVSSPANGQDEGRYAVSSEFRDYHPPTMTIPQSLNADTKRLLEEIEQNTQDADIPTIMNNLEHAASSLQSAYRLVCSNTSALPKSHKDTIKRSHDSSFGEFEQTVQRIAEFNR